MRARVGIDVDGPCADLVGGFLRWFNSPDRDWYQHIPYEVTRDMVTSHNDMGSSPRIRKVDRAMRRWYRDRCSEYGQDGPHGGFGGAFLQFMRQPTVYTDYIEPVAGAPEAVARLQETCDCMFVTALMKRANQHVPDKLDWIGQNFPGIPISTVPSEYKWWVRPHFGIDDRWDTVDRWLKAGVHGLLFKTPWSDDPSWAARHDWNSILEVIGSFNPWEDQ